MRVLKRRAVEQKTALNLKPLKSLASWEPKTDPLTLLVLGSRRSTRSPGSLPTGR